MQALADIHAARDEVARKVEAVHAAAALAVAERDKLESVLPALRTHRDHAASQPATRGRMALLASQLGLDEQQENFLWASVALAIDPRVLCLAEALAGPLSRRGLSVATHSQMFGLEDAAAHALAIWLARSNPLVDNGLLYPDETAVAVARVYAAPPRLLAFLQGNDVPDDGIRIVAAAAPGSLVLDDVQRDKIRDIGRIFSGARTLLVIEGPRNSGRTTAVACALQRTLAVTNVASLLGADVRTRLLELRREALLQTAVPVVEGCEHLRPEDRPLVTSFVERYSGDLVVETTPGDVALDTRRAIVRKRWHVPEVTQRRELWTRFAGDEICGGLDSLASRFPVGPGMIARAVETARVISGSVDAPALTAGLRHNISEDLGGLAQHVEVTQTWNDLVLAPDTLHQVQTLVARVRHAYQVMEHWNYRGKLARGVGVPALFSGPPGTGKTMVAGLVARELDLDLYQVDLSQIVSKWVGETEKQLARVFDAAEQGHGLLLFDEADALFGQRTQDVKSAVDRYANLEVNYLLQRVESFGGITILTTNLDQSIDRALKRRLAAHIVFDAPDEEDRTRLWRTLIATGSAPLARDIDARALANEFPKMTGANIRNAAVAAAFLAAAEGAPEITYDILVRAARAEYRSMGYVLAERWH